MQQRCETPNSSRPDAKACVSDHHAHCSSEGLLTDWWRSAEPRKGPHIMLQWPNRCSWTSGIVTGPSSSHQWVSKPSSVCVQPCLILSCCSKGSRSLSSSLKPRAQIPTPPFPCIVPFLFSVIVLSLAAYIIQYFTYFFKNHAFTLLLPSSCLSGLCCCSQPRFWREQSPYPALLQWGGGSRSVPSDLSEGPGTIYTPTGTPSNYSHF